MGTTHTCDRCGVTFDGGGRWLRWGHTNGSRIVGEADLCPDCMDGFAKWMDCYRESVREHSLESESVREQSESVRERHYESQDVTGCAERVTEQAESLHDTREQLELDVTAYLIKVCTWERQRFELRVEVERWLDRQAAITEAECERICDTCDWPSLAAQPDQEAYDRIAELRKYIVKTDRLGAALDERDDQLADARESLEAAWDDNAELGDQVDTLKAKLDAEAQHAREAWQLWGEADVRAEQAETERDEMAQRIQTLELEIAKRDKGIERLKRRRGELTEQLGAMADRMAKDGR